MENKEKLIACLQSKLDFYSDLVKDVKNDINSVENLNERVCAIKNLLHVECNLMKLYKHIKMISAKCCNDCNCGSSKGKCGSNSQSSNGCGC